jgi:2-iminoacetate synthase ThiH
MAGSRTPESLTTSDLQRLIRAAGREPHERDTLYNLVGATGAMGALSTAPL